MIRTRFRFRESVRCAFVTDKSYESVTESSKHVVTQQRRYALD